jgi:hypothetical protein
VQLGDDSALDESDAGFRDVARYNEDILGHSVTSFPARWQERLVCRRGGAPPLRLLGADAPREPRASHICAYEPERNKSLLSGAAEALPALSARGPLRHV